MERVFLLRSELPHFRKISGTRTLVIFTIHTFSLALHFLQMFLNTLISLTLNLWVFDFQSSIKAFVSKMQILREEAKTNNYSHFCHFQEFNATVDVDFYEELDLEEAKKDLLHYLENLTANMNARFKDLIAESLDFAQFPFKADTKHCGAIALEMAELQEDNEARTNFDVFQDIAKFWIQLPNKHSTVRNRTVQVLVRFGTTYVCEAGFSILVFIKNDYCSRKTNINLENSLVRCLTSHIPRYKKLGKE